MLTAAGLTTKDVTMVNLQPAEALAAFTSGSVDAWDIWPPYVQQVVAQDGAKVLARGPQYGSPYSYEVASKAAVANPAKAAAIQVYLATLDKAYVWAEKNPDAWGTAWAAATGLPASITDVAATVDSTTPVVINSTITHSEQGLVTQFYKAGLIPSQPTMSGYITSPVQHVGQRQLTPGPELHSVLGAANPLPDPEPGHQHPPDGRVHSCDPETPRSSLRNPWRNRAITAETPWIYLMLDGRGRRRRGAGTVAGQGGDDAGRAGTMQGGAGYGFRRGGRRGMSVGASKSGCASSCHTPPANPWTFPCLCSKPWRQKTCPRCGS